MRLLGPIVATNDADARALAEYLAADSAEPVRIDLPPEEHTLLEWGRAAGLEMGEIDDAHGPWQWVIAGRRREWTRALAARAFG